MQQDSGLRGEGRGVAGLAVACAILWGACAGPASAESCLEEAGRLAEDYNLSIVPPEADSAPDAVEPGDLARSGGVIEPPPTSDPATIEPPDNVGGNMPTVPNIPDDQAAPLPEGAGPSRLSPSDQATVESILTAARAEAERGDEKACFERLEEAKRVVQGGGS